MLTKDELQRRVNTGAELLDKENEGWRDRININRLDMNDCMDCMLGQLYDGYVSGREELNLGIEESKKCGFNFWSQDLVDDRDGIWKMLKDLWVEEIETCV